MVWMLLKWIGMLLGSLLLLVIVCLLYLIVRNILYWRRRRRCPACGGKKFTQLDYIDAIKSGGEGGWFETLLCENCQRILHDSSEQTKMGVITDEEHIERIWKNQAKYAAYQKAQCPPLKVTTVRRRR